MVDTEIQQKDFFRKLVETTSAVAWSFDIKSQCFTYMSPQITALTGYPPATWTNLESWKSRLHPSEREEVASFCARETELCNDHKCEYRVIRPDGNSVWLRDEISVFSDNGIPVTLRGNFYDISELKEAQLALMESEQRYRQIFEKNRSVKLIINPENGQIVEANKAAANFYGYDIETLTTMNINQINTLSDEETHAAMSSARSESRLYFNFKHKVSSGEVRDVEVYSGPLESKGKILLYSIIHDVTDRNRAEEALHRSQKMDAIDQLTGGIAHDFNNILGIILGNLNLLERNQELDENCITRIKNIKHSTQRAVELTRQLLRFSSNQVVGTMTTDINRVIRETDSLLRQSLTPSINVEHKLMDNLWLTNINVGEFEDCLLNLALNARDAMSGSGTLSLVTENCTLDENACAHLPDLMPGDYVRLSVSDEGKGISDSMQSRVFEPFFTTKDHADAIGFGLSMVFGFAKRSGGYVTVQSELGAGATFILFLPRSLSKETAAKPDQAQTAEIPGGRETILVVDDESAFVDLVKEVLEEIGYKVFTASNGKRAEEVLLRSSKVDLLFSDVVMPGDINGYELAKHAIKINPDIKVLLTSGHTDISLRKNSGEQAELCLLSKPFTLPALAKNIRLMLDE